MGPVSGSWGLQRILGMKTEKGEDLGLTVGSQITQTFLLHLSCGPLKVLLLTTWHILYLGEGEWS